MNHFHKKTVFLPHNVVGLQYATLMQSQACAYSVFKSGSDQI